MSLPKPLPYDLHQTQWAQQIDPILARPANQSNILPNVKLTTGTNAVNHLLGRKLQGWNPVRIRSAATFYDQQDSNQHPELTLILISSADVVIDLEVF